MYGRPNHYAIKCLTAKRYIQEEQLIKIEKWLHYPDGGRIRSHATIGLLKMMIKEQYMHHLRTVANLTAELTMRMVPHTMIELMRMEHNTMIDERTEQCTTKDEWYGILIVPVTNTSTGHSMRAVQCNELPQCVPHMSVTAAPKPACPTVQHQPIDDRYDSQPVLPTNAMLGRTIKPETHKESSCCPSQAEPPSANNSVLPIVQ